MFLILNAFILSFGVFARMIIPVFMIFFATSVVWSLLNVVTAGYADALSQPVTSALITLFGIRAALSLKGDARGTDLKILILNSVKYGVFFFVVLGGLSIIISVTAVVLSLWQLGQPISFTEIKDAAEPVQTAFAFLTVGTTVITLYVVFAAVYAAMAVPMAGAAQEAGYGAPSRSFFDGFGRSFIPLFFVFFVSIFLQFFFGILTAFFALLPILLSFVSIVVAQSLPDIDLDTILKGLASGAALLWLNSWVWSVCALAFLKFNGDDTPRATAPSPVPETATDIRALRKSRERSF